MLNIILNIKLLQIVMELSVYGLCIQYTHMSGKCVMYKLKNNQIMRKFCTQIQHLLTRHTVLIKKNNIVTG